MDFKFKNTWRIDCFEYDGGPLLWSETRTNLMPDESITNVLSSTFVSAGTYSWYVGLVDNAGFTTFSYSDVAAQIGGSNGWAEFTSYSEGVRQALVFGTPGSSGGVGQIDNTASTANFTISASGTVAGSFFATASALGATTGVIGGEVNFTGGNTAVVNGNVLQVTVIIEAAG